MSETIKTPAEAIARLKEGNARFVADSLKNEKRDSAERKKWVTKQDPFAVILSCADSRVVPELAFDTGLGELFVLRVAGNVANTSTIASIEYAVANLDTPVIVVMGHESCGAVTAAVKRKDLGHNLNHLLVHILPALDQAGEKAELAEVVELNAQLNAKDLAARSSIISKAVEDGTLQIVSAYYELGTGAVRFHG